MRASEKSTPDGEEVEAVITAQEDDGFKKDTEPLKNAPLQVNPNPNASPEKVQFQEQEKPIEISRELWANGLPEIRTGQNLRGKSDTQLFYEACDRVSGNTEKISPKQAQEAYLEFLLSRDPARANSPEGRVELSNYANSLFKKLNDDMDDLIALRSMKRGNHTKQLMLYMILKEKIQTKVKIVLPENPVAAAAEMEKTTPTPKQTIQPSVEKASEPESAEFKGVEVKTKPEDTSTISDEDEKDSKVDGDKKSISEWMRRAGIRILKDKKIFAEISKKGVDSEMSNDEAEQVYEEYLERKKIPMKKRPGMKKALLKNK